MVTPTQKGEKMLSPFPCTACGKCCQNVDKSEQTVFLDRGDGTCRHFNEDTKLCLIYENRPLVCQPHASDDFSYCNGLYALYLARLQPL